MSEEKTADGEHKPIKKADLARHWGCSPAYISKLVKTKGLPVTPAGHAGFADLAAADAWRLLTAPPNAASSRPEAITADSASMEKRDEATGKIAPTKTTTTTTDQKAPAGENGNGVAGADESSEGRGDGSAPNNGAEIIDVTKYIRRDVDFDTLMIRQAEGVPQVAHGLYERACSAGKPVEIAANLKNWHESAKAAAGVREKFLELQEKTRALLPLDEVMDIVGMELQPARTAMIKLGDRIGAAANPENPELASRVINAAVDEIFRQFDNVLDRAAKELAG